MLDYAWNSNCLKVEQQLRSEAFGYRAKFIQRAAAEIGDRGGLEWFEKIQNMSYKEAHAELITLTGIGPKVIQTTLSAFQITRAATMISHNFTNLFKLSL